MQRPFYCNLLQTASCVMRLQDMTYVKQLEDYEEAVMAKRLAEMPAEELERLLAEVLRHSNAKHRRLHLLNMQLLYVYSGNDRANPLQSRTASFEPCATHLSINPGRWRRSRRSGRSARSSCCRRRSGAPTSDQPRLAQWC